MNIDELIEKADISDIPETYQPVAKLIGIGNFVKLCMYAMGDEIYFPTPERALRVTRNRLIMEEYNGYNAVELSRKYNLTSQCIKAILRG